ncbi:MAG: carbohydrate-binding domain-containing protein [Ruminococcus sp.]|nr:carbohydrate-binding domain-containing protein [Ruminococcus sp.]
MKARIFSAAMLALILAAVSGCSINTSESTSKADTAAVSETSGAAEADNSADDTASSSEASAEIKLNGTSAEIPEGTAGVSAEGSVITVTKAGSYSFTGTLDDGRIIVNAPKTDKVDIYLNNVTVTSSSSAPVRVEQADGVTLHLVEGTVNTFTDSAANDVSACISAKDDLTIKGKGTLNVTGVAKHAIKSSNDVKIKNGVLNLKAASAGVYGEDKVQITGGTITVTACKDGIKSVNETEAGKGIVTCEEAAVDIQNASGNGIEATTSVTVTSGSIKIHSIKQAVNCKTQAITEGCVVKY